jgi:hypothetical protein
MKKPRRKSERLYAGHLFRDIGPPVNEADYEPIIRGIPEHALAVAFIEMKQDYGGPLPIGDQWRLAELAAALAATPKQAATKKPAGGLGAM